MNLYVWLNSKKIEVLTAIVSFFTGIVGGIMLIAWSFSYICKGNHALVFDSNGVHRAIREEKEKTVKRTTTKKS